MHGRRRWLVPAAAFLGGLIVGAVAIGFPAKRNNEDLLLRWAVSNTFEETLTLRQIHGGRADRTEERLYAALPGFAANLASHEPHAEVVEALWAIRLAYTDSGRSIPAEIEPLLRDLPATAAPRCRARWDSLGGGAGSSPGPSS